MQHMMEDNLSVVAVKRVKASSTWQHCLIANTLIESCFISNQTSEISYLFPLYLYPDKENVDLFSVLQSEKRPNLQEKVIEQIKNKYLHETTPEEVVSYIYGILFSNIYRQVYFEFLKIDLPRIPFTTNWEVFKEISRLGQMLIDLHLLTSPHLSKTSVKYQGQGDDHTIGKPNYQDKDNRVYINKTHYFENVIPEVWAYQIGSYQVMHKFLKDRKGQKMDDPRHYIHIATALQKTIEIQAEIDEIYPEVEKDVIAF